MMSVFFQQQQKTSNNSNWEIDFWNKKFDNLVFFSYFTKRKGNGRKLSCNLRRGSCSCKDTIHFVQRWDNSHTHTHKVPVNQCCCNYFQLLEVDDSNPRVNATVRVYWWHKMKIHFKNRHITRKQFPVVNSWEKSSPTYCFPLWNLSWEINILQACEHWLDYWSICKSLSRYWCFQTGYDWCVSSGRQDSARNSGNLLQFHPLTNL